MVRITILFLLGLLTAHSVAAANKVNSGLGVGISATVANRTGPSPVIIATQPPDGSTTETQTPVFQFTFNVDMNVNLTDVSQVLLPSGLIPTQLVWADARTLNILYSGSLDSFGAKRVELFDNYFRTPGNVPLPKGSGLAFNYGLVQPTFTVQPSFSPAAPLTSDIMTFTCLATSPVAATLMYTWTFGDGTVGSGATVQHQYAKADAYLVTIVVTDGSGGQLFAAMLVKVGQGAAGLPPGALPWTVTRTHLHVGFKVVGRDSIQVQGTLSLPAGYNPLNQMVNVSVGSITASFKMDKNGRSKSGPNRFTLIRKLKKKQFLGGPVKINFILHGDFAKALVASGVPTVATPKAGTLVALPTSIIVNNQLYVDMPKVLLKVNKTATSGIGRFVLRK
jgi:hypothetical protein